MLLGDFWDKFDGEFYGSGFFHVVTERFDHVHGDRAVIRQVCLVDRVEA